MAAQELLTILESGLLLIGLLIAFFYLRSDYEVDRFRQDMFRVRDEMFDYALDGNISYVHPAYIQLRDLANGLIRFAHRMTIWRILTMFILYSLLGVHRTLTFSADLEKSIASIGSPEVQAKMRGFHNRISSEVFRQLVGSSCLFWPLISLGLAKYIITKRIRVARSRAKKEATNWIEEQAIACA